MRLLIVTPKWKNSTMSEEVVGTAYCDHSVPCERCKGKIREGEKFISVTEILRTRSWRTYGATHKLCERCMQELGGDVV